MILHLNNLENLSEAEADGAADILRSLRDIVFQCDFLHVLIVGTTSAVQTAVNKHAQLRSLFGTTVVEPLLAADVHHLLRERYLFLRLHQARPAGRPVTDDTVDALYDLFRGDLRGLLRALHDGVGAVVGLGNISGSTSDKTGAVLAPLTLDAIRPALQHTYLTELHSLGERRRVEQLLAWGRSDPAAVHTQSSLRVLWKLGQSAVSTALDALVRLGYVVVMARVGGAVEYGLSGRGRLMFG